MPRSPIIAGEGWHVRKVACHLAGRWTQNPFTSLATLRTFKRKRRRDTCTASSGLMASTHWWALCGHCFAFQSDDQCTCTHMCAHTHTHNSGKRKWQGREWRSLSIGFFFLIAINYFRVVHFKVKYQRWYWTLSILPWSLVPQGGSLWKCDQLGRAAVIGFCMEPVTYLLRNCWLALAS